LHNKNNISVSCGGNIHSLTVVLITGFYFLVFLVFLVHLLQHLQVIFSTPSSFTGELLQSFYDSFTDAG